MTWRTTRLSAAFLVLLASPALAHSWYDDRKDPTTFATCCGGFDCAPIMDEDVMALGDGSFFYKPEKYFIDRNRVQRSPDERYHICIVISYADQHTPGTFMSRHVTCFFAPALGF